MRKINLDPYDVETSQGSMPYEVKTSMVSLLYSPTLKLSPKELLDNDRLARKIEEFTGAAILEEEEYQRILKALNSLTGLQKNDVEFVQRIMDAPEISVKEG